MDCGDLWDIGQDVLSSALGLCSIPVVSPLVGRGNCSLKPLGCCGSLGEGTPAQKLIFPWLINIRAGTKSLLQPPSLPWLLLFVFYLVFFICCQSSCPSPGLSLLLIWRNLKGFSNPNHSGMVLILGMPKPRKDVPKSLSSHFNPFLITCWQQACSNFLSQRW